MEASTSMRMTNYCEQVEADLEVKGAGASTCILPRRQCASTPCLPCPFRQGRKGKAN